MFEPDSLVAEHSISLYVDYPDELTVEADSGIVPLEANTVVVEVIKAVTALITESHMASIPIFLDRLTELVEGVTKQTIEMEKFNLDADKTVNVLINFITTLSEIIRPVVQGYIPPIPVMFVTTIINVECRDDCVVITIHY